MKNFILCTCLVVLHVGVFCQPGYYKDDYSRLSIGPTFGGLGILTFYKSDKIDFYYGYFAGLKTHIRPIRALGLTVGANYNKLIGKAEFYNAPVILNLFLDNGVIISGGPVSFFPIIDKNFDLNNPLWGYSFSIIIEPIGFYLVSYPKTLIPKCQL